jgi:hypothetical protein
MKLSNLTDEDLQKVAMMKTRKGIATSEAKRAQQILRTRNITHGFTNDKVIFQPPASNNLERDYKSFEELHGCKLEDYKEGIKAGDVLLRELQQFCNNEKEVK